MILCTVLAIAVIVAGAAVFAVYTLFKPKMPYLAVSDARLGLLQYDQGGTIQSLQMSITIRAENNNSRADATFSRVDLALGFHGVDVALLRAEPFVVARGSSLPLRYNVVSARRTLRGCRLWMRRPRLQAWCRAIRPVGQGAHSVEGGRLRQAPVLDAHLVPPALLLPWKRHRRAHRS